MDDEYANENRLLQIQRSTRFKSVSKSSQTQAILEKDAIMQLETETIEIFIGNHVVGRRESRQRRLTNNAISHNFESINVSAF